MNRLYFISMSAKGRGYDEYIEAKNLYEALKIFSVLHVCEGYDGLIIRRIYRQIEMRHTIEQFARKNTQKYNQLKTIKL